MSGEDGGDAPARLMIVDDHPIWRNSLREVLEHASVGWVVAEASDGAAAIERARETGPDLIIMDVHLPGMSGIDATRILLSERPSARVLVLSSSDERAQVLEAVHAGASGYMLKTAGPDEVAEATRRVHRGELIFPAALSDVVLGEFRRLGTEGPAARPISVIVADPTAIARDWLVRVLGEAGLRVLAQTDDAAGLFDAIEADIPDVVIIDARIASSRPGGRISVAQRIKSTHVGVGILVLSSDVESAAAVGLMSDGADKGGIGYLLKDRIEDGEDLTDSIARVARGEPVVDPQIVRGLVARGRGEGPLGGLTAREREVLALMAEGRSNQGICGRLRLSDKAVEAHVRNIFSKLGLEQTADDSRRVLAVIAYLRSAGQA